MWLRTLLLALLIFFLLRFVMRLVRGVAAGMSAGGGGASRPKGGQSAVKMVADPVCGTYVIPDRALQVSRGRDTHYFCSEKCRDTWQAAR